MNRFLLYALAVIGFIVFAPESGPGKEPRSGDPRLTQIKTIFVRSYETPGCDRVAPSTEYCYDAAGATALLDLEKFTCYHHAALEQSADAVLRVNFNSMYAGVISMTLRTTEGEQIWVWAGAFSYDRFSGGFLRQTELIVHRGLRRLQEEAWPGTNKHLGGLKPGACARVWEEFPPKPLM